MGRTIAAGVVVAAAVVAAVAPVPAAWVEQYYSRGWFPAAQRALTTMSNGVPFAVLDVLLLAGTGLAIAALASVARAPRGRRLSVLGRRALQGGVGVSLAYLAFLAVWGGNYRRPPIGEMLDFDAGRVTRTAVADLNDTAIAELNRLRPRFPADTREWPDARQAASELHQALETGSRLLGLDSAVQPSRPKRSLLDVYFTRAGVSGMTDPYFLETLLASNLLPFELPAVIAHEWGHLAGFARESDASFFGLLVCLHGHDGAQYSAWLDIFVRTLGARDASGVRAALARLSDGVRGDLAAMEARSARDEVYRVRLLAWRTYDTYLRSQRVESGVRNYGEVVRLLAGTRFEAGWRPVLKPAR